MFVCASIKYYVDVRILSVDGCWQTYSRITVVFTKSEGVYKNNFVGIQTATSFENSIQKIFG